MKTNQKTLIEGEIKPVETMAAQTWKRFRRHPGAMVGAVVIILMVLTVLMAPLSPYGPEESDIKNRFQAPSQAHPFGTDGLGRDVLTRTFYHWHFGWYRCRFLWRVDRQHPDENHRCHAIFTKFAVHDPVERHLT